MFKHEKYFSIRLSVENQIRSMQLLLQEQLGGANGELKAALQYMSQSFRIKTRKSKICFLI